MLGYDWPRLHALLNDLPIALLVTAVFFDLMALASRRTLLRQVAFSTLIVGVLGAGAAVLSGLQAEDHIAHGEAVHRVMESHEDLGLISLSVFAVIALWRIIRESRMGALERAILVSLSVGGVGLLFATGVYGGRLVFEHAAGIPSTVLETELHERTEGHQHSGEAPRASRPLDSSVVEPSRGHVDPPGTPPHTHPPSTPPHMD
jgi:uncharacterized membrane protein